MTRDEQFAADAAKYYELWTARSVAAEAERKANAEWRKAEEALQAVAKKLGEYVGANVTRRVAVVAGTTVVRVEYDAGNAACKPGGRVTIDEAVLA